MTRAALLAGAAVPFLYFGAQLAALPFYPDYDIVRQVASELGSPGSRVPAVFNTGALLTGVCSMIAGWGFWRALPAVAGTPRILAALVALAVFTSGLGGLQAAVFPLPDPRHNPGWLGAGLFAMPALLLAALWKLRAARPFLLACVIVFLVQFPLRAGVLGIDVREAGGLLQRLLALAVFPPIGVSAFYLLRTSSPRWTSSIT